MKDLTDKWLFDTAEELKASGLDRREWADYAAAKWRKEVVADAMQSGKEIDYHAELNQLYPQLDRVHSHFLIPSERRSGLIGPIFEGAFYFHGNFWRFIVPLTFTPRRVRVFNYLDIHRELRAKVYADKDAIQSYKDIFDAANVYAYGREKIEGSTLGEYAKQFLGSGDKHLNSATTLLLRGEANPKAIEESRMAVEIFLKAFLIAKDGLTETDFKSSVKHNLEDAFNRCTAKGRMPEVKPYRDQVLALPSIESRYESVEIPLGEQFAAYKLSLIVAATVLNTLFPPAR